MSVAMVPRPLVSAQTASQKPNIPADLDETWIAVMGVTGAGKSRFISACTGKDVQIGHSLESCTTEVDDYSFVWKDKRVHLIDTPGFDDTHKSDREVLEGIASWLSTAYSRDIKLSGVLYLHRITDIRLGGTGLRNLTMFKKLCGDQFYPRVFLVTTRWDEVSGIDGEKREQELISKSDFWGTMIKGGASFERHYGTRDSAMDILREVIRNPKVDAPKVLKVQHEMVDDKLRLDQTDAGRQFEAELLKQREKHEHEMKQMQEDVKMLLDMNEKRAAAETERQRQIFEERITQSFDDQAKLKSTLEEIQRRQVEDVARMQERIAREQAAYEEQIRNLQRAQSDLNHMDPSSQAARDMQSQIVEGKAEAARMAQNLAEEDKTFQKKVKRVFIKGWGKSRDLFRNNPNVARMVVRTGASLLVKLAEWELLSEITGVDCSSLGPLLSPFTSNGGGGGGGGGEDGGSDDVGNDGDVENPDDMGTPPVADAPSPGGCPSDPVNGGTDTPEPYPDGNYSPSIVPPGLDTQDFPPSPYAGTGSPEPPPTYSAATDIYDQMAYSAVAQESMDSAISGSQQFEADQAQQVSNATAISGIAAGNDVYETTTTTPAVDSLSSQMNQMNVGSMQYQPLQAAASMQAV